MFLYHLLKLIVVLYRFFKIKFKKGKLLIKDPISTGPDTPAPDNEGPTHNTYPSCRCKDITLFGNELRCSNKNPTYGQEFNECTRGNPESRCSNSDAGYSTLAMPNSGYSVSDEDKTTFKQPLPHGYYMTQSVSQKSVTLYQQSWANEKTINAWQCTKRSAQLDYQNREHSGALALPSARTADNTYVV